MATSKKSGTHITRITATDKPIKAARPSVAEVRQSLKKKRTPVAATAAVVKTPKVKREKSDTRSWFVRGLFAFGGYFKGAWIELRKVRWPNTKATWSLTIAVLIFCAFFVILILLLDALFKYVFELILK